MKTKNLSIFLTVLLIACSDVDDNPKPDRTQFEILLEKAQQNDAEAQYNLGRMYHYGEDVPRDFATAKAWTTRLEGMSVKAKQSCRRFGGYLRRIAVQNSAQQPPGAQTMALPLLSNSSSFHPRYPIY